MERKDLLYEKRNQAAWITLNRPQALNAITPELVRSLRIAAEDAQKDNDIRAVAITGAGRGFCGYSCDGQRKPGALPRVLA